MWFWSRRIGFLCLIVFPLLQVGCGTLSKNQCREGSWHKIGRKDGAEGQPYRARLDLHQTACKSYKIKIDETLYQQGWHAGIKSFCTPNKGFHYGLRGYSYQGVCPKKMEFLFLAAYRWGTRIGRVLAAQASSEEQQSALYEKSLDNELTEEERDHHRNEYYRLQSEQSRLADEIARLKEDAKRALTKLGIEVIFS